MTKAFVLHCAKAVILHVFRVPRGLQHQRICGQLTKSHVVLLQPAPAAGAACLGVLQIPADRLQLSDAVRITLHEALQVWANRRGGIACVLTDCLKSRVGKLFVGAMAGPA
jgi:hypothetical protein